jgi:UbiD family decarboxylase
MAFRDMRQFLNHLEKTGDVVRVSEQVDVNYEIGAITRHAATLDSPAPYFTNVRSFETPVISNLFGTRRRVAAALETDVKNLIQEWRKRTVGTIEPVVVKDAPCKENVILGDRVDLMQFPVPIFNEIDGGPFITAGCHVSEDPKGGRNLGIYRNQVHGPRTLGILAAPYRHLILHAKSNGGRLPVAIAVGVQPAVFLAAGADYPFGVDEMGKAGSFQGEPVELIRCETSSLLVPATAEIVIEGELVLDKLQTEGPFGEFTGYYGTTASRPTIDVKALTHRNKPIYQAGYTGRPPNENVTAVGVAREADILGQLTLPGLLALHLTDGGCGYFNAVASIDKRFEGYGKMMAMAILGTWAGRAIKTLIIVDSDVDPYDATDVEWAVATRVQPARDVEIIKQTVGVILDPSIDRADRLSGASRTSKMIIDATRYDAADYEAEVLPRKDVFDRIVRGWDRFGIPSGSPS